MTEWIYKVLSSTDSKIKKKSTHRRGHKADERAWDHLVDLTLPLLVEEVGGAVEELQPHLEQQH